MLVIVSNRTLEPVLFKDRERQKDNATYIEIYVECRAHPPYTHTHTHLPSSNATQFKNLPLILHSQWPRTQQQQQTTAASIFYCCFFCYCYCCCFCFFVFYFLSARVLSPFVAIIVGRSSLPIGSEHSTLGRHSVRSVRCARCSMRIAAGGKLTLYIRLQAQKHVQRVAAAGSLCARCS